MYPLSQVLHELWGRVTGTKSELCSGGDTKCRFQVLSGVAAVLSIMISQADMSLDRDKDNYKKKTKHYS